MNCPHQFYHLDVYECAPDVDWGIDAQRQFATQIKGLGRYNTVKSAFLGEPSPDPEKVFLTPNGVLQVCLLQTAPFQTKDPNRIRTMRDEQHSRACKDRPALTERLAQALLRFEAASRGIVQSLQQIKPHAQAALTTVHHALAYLAFLRSNKRLPKQDTRLPNSETIGQAYTTIAQALGAIPDDSHTRIKEMHAIQLLTNQSPTATLVQHIGESLGEHVSVTKGEAYLIAASILMAFGVIDQRAPRLAADTLRQMVDDFEKKGCRP